MCSLAPPGITDGAGTIAAGIRCGSIHLCGIRPRRIGVPRNDQARGLPVSGGPTAPAREGPTVRALADLSAQALADPNGQALADLSVRISTGPNVRVPVDRNVRVLVLSVQRLVQSVQM